MVICPGIGNHSEKHYIRTFVDYAQKQGYRCAVLNHLGALPNIELTSPRMFTYGKDRRDKCLCVTITMTKCFFLQTRVLSQQSSSCILAAFTPGVICLA